MTRLLPCSMFLATVAAAVPVGRAAGSEPPVVRTDAPVAGSSEAAGAAASQDALMPIDSLLDRLEHAADDLRDYTASIAYQRVDALTEESEFRYGRLIVEVSEDRTRRIAIVFDQYVDGTGRSDTLDERFVFSGSWVCEIDGTRKQFIKRQIVPPDQRFDPLKIGEGPFPIPIGQSAKEVRAQFAVTHAPPPSANLLAPLRPDTIHALRLVPAPGTDAARDFAQIDLYYDRSTFMPVGVDALGVDGGRRVARLTRAATNAGLTREEAATLSIEPPDGRDWTIDIRAWKAE